MGARSIPRNKLESVSGASDLATLDVQGLVDGEFSAVVTFAICTDDAEQRLLAVILRNSYGYVRDQRDPDGVASSRGLKMASRVGIETLG